ncbi:hypothetical protein UPYG_G00082840, partial [Umbra pygmaea]
STSEETSVSDQDESLLNFLRRWAVQHNTPLIALDSLLSGLRCHGHPDLPKSGRTLMKTPRLVEVEAKSGMQYVHFKLQEEIIRHLDCYPDHVSEQAERVEISLNIDGLPLFKSSKATLWPILCAIHLEPPVVFPVTLTLGPSKPSDLKFMDDMVNELQVTLSNGIDFRGQTIAVDLRCIICDAPAKAMVKKVKHHTGYNGCDKCTQRGVWLGRMTFPDVEDLTLVTDESYRRTMEKNHEESGACQLNFKRLRKLMLRK